MTLARIGALARVQALRVTQARARVDAARRELDAARSAAATLQQHMASLDAAHRQLLGITQVALLSAGLTAARHDHLLARGAWLDDRRRALDIEVARGWAVCRDVSLQLTVAMRNCQLAQRRAEQTRAVHRRAATRMAWRQQLVEQSCAPTGRAMAATPMERA